MSDNPYASPSYAPADKFAPNFNATSHVYKPLPILLNVIKVLAIVTTTVSVTVSVVELAGMASASTLSAEELADTLTPFDMVSGLLALMLAPVTIGWNICYLVAVYRVTANSHALGRPRPESSPGFAVGSYFIPILNLFKPYQIMKECYTACRVDSTSLLGFWWAAHIIFGILSQVSFRLSMSSIRMESAQAAASMQQLATLIDVVNLPVLITLAIYSQLVLSRLAARQSILASQSPDSTGWTPAMLPLPQKPLSNWGGD